MPRRSVPPHRCPRWDGWSGPAGTNRYDPRVTPSPHQSAPTQRHTLNVGGGHVVAFETHGHEDGIPAVVLHGGPGSSSTPLLRRGFDLSRYRVVSIDQRGAGESAPRGSTLHNTTDDLLDDLCRVRDVLGIKQWLVVGGSWGATLAVAHAAAQPHAVSALLLRSPFLARPEDLAWFFQGAADERPHAWQRLASLAPPDQRDQMLPWLTSTLRDGTPWQQRQAALAWWQWEQTMAGTSSDAAEPPPPLIANTQNARTNDAWTQRLVDRYRVQSHYLIHACFFDQQPLLDRCLQVPRVPTLLIHGRQDRVCRPEGATALHQALPGSRLQWLDGVGHDAAHPLMQAAIAQALDHHAAHAQFQTPDTATA